MFTSAPFLLILFRAWFCAFNFRSAKLKWGLKRWRFNLILWDVCSIFSQLIKWFLQPLKPAEVTSSFDLRRETGKLYLKSSHLWCCSPQCKHRTTAASVSLFTGVRDTATIIVINLSMLRFCRSLSTHLLYSLLALPAFYFTAELQCEKRAHI